MLKSILANKHTSGAALVVGVLELVSAVGAIWFPAYKEQLNMTVTEIQKFALMYGLVMAGDAQPKPQTPNNP